MTKIETQYEDFLKDLLEIGGPVLKEAGWSQWYSDHNWIPPKHIGNPDYNGHSLQQAILCHLARAEDWAELAKKHGRIAVQLFGKQGHV